MLVASEDAGLLLECVESAHITSAVIEERDSPAVAPSVVEEEKIDDTSELASTRWTPRWQDVVERLRFLHAYASSCGHVGLPRLKCASSAFSRRLFSEVFSQVVPSSPTI